MPIRIHPLVAALCLLLAILGAHHVAAQQGTIGLVTIEAGDLPIILSAPHGGSDAIPSVPVRQGEGEGVDRFNARSDFGTDKLTEKLADAIEEKLGKRPYTVIARFHRKYLDANRRERDAYESQQAKAVYDTYHQGLADARQDVIKRWGQGILFDIHGQGADPNAIFRGTQNGKTATHLVTRFGQEALRGQTSLFGQLAKHGLQVIPIVDSVDRENPRYGGGYIVRTYGSGSGGTLDAIQLELGRGLRSSEAAPTTAAKLANSIAAFAGHYLPKAERVSQVNRE
jgi:N-formylglutamate amidohydrolase